MAKEPATVRFQNRANPQSKFDLIRLEDLFRRADLEPSPHQLHRVEFFLVLLVTHGEGYHTVDFTDYKYEKGTLITIRKGQIHKFFKSEHVKGFLILFTDDFLITYLEKSQTQQSLQLFNELLGVPKIQLSEGGFQEVKGIIERMAKEYFAVNDRYSSGVIRSELHILITKLYRIKSQRHQIIFNKKYLAEFIQFQKLVEDNVTETTRVQDYAKLMAISTKTLNSVAKSIVSKTAKEFIDEICIKQSKRLLINTPLSIKEIAYASGFEETTNFYKYFKRQVGTTPEQFRKAH